MTIKDVTDYLEQIAPPRYQESYDNAGLIVGEPDQAVTGIICCLDSTEAVVEEAAAKGCNLIVAHHPIIFRGLKSLTGRNYVERTVMSALRKGIAIYAIHTNLDNVYAKGVNQRIGETLGLQNTRILAPKNNLQQLHLRLHVSESELLTKSLAKHRLDHLPVSWNRESDQTGISITFRYSSAEKSGLLRAVREVTGKEPAVSSWPIAEPDPAVGSGLLGELKEPMKENEFLQFVKERMQCSCIRYTDLTGKKVKTVALCGGAGGFLLPTAIAAGADAFITADYKYHEFFDADGRILLADIGHFESEQYTIQLLQELLSKKFSNFAAWCTEVRTNPVHYLV